MADQMKIPVKGVVENYSWLECPDCGKKLYPFGKSHLEEIAGEEKLQIIGRVPMKPEFAEEMCIRDRRKGCCNRYQNRG